ncbi:sulfotransferase family 2 domain-containing protein [Aestuariivirga sp.]|uniref:sulfotransferase family 2 domain-containing protein n=1 Tax=Aestuariivirga sp. TaxID=2650926 RepID=UPI0025BA4CEB|nr:sulfotransferase family 2 domain-containing protein [Aestuariivirga sp.]MCA3554397.1 sulfotransferase family 2 domain-containing protein [Aestuariivirga sp.]
MPLYQYRKDPFERTFLFIHVPKTGGTAIETFFRGVGLAGYFDPPAYAPVRPYIKVPPAHYDYEVLSRLFELDRLYSFAIVRDPVRRMVSQYKWAAEKSTQAETIAKMDFGSFLRLMFAEYRRDENVAAGHFKPQVRFVGAKVTKIFRYEAGLETIIRQVLEDVGFKPQGELRLPMVNTSSARKVEPTAADIALIRDVYAEDCKAFGYDAGPPPNDAMKA